MSNRSGLSFADVLIILAVVLLLAALAVPKFIKAPDFGNEVDDIVTNDTNDASSQDATNRINQDTSRPDMKARTTQLTP